MLEDLTKIGVNLFYAIWICVAYEIWKYAWIKQGRLEAIKNHWRRRELGGVLSGVIVLAGWLFVTSLLLGWLK